MLGLPAAVPDLSSRFRYSVRNIRLGSLFIRQENGICSYLEGIGFVYCWARKDLTYGGTSQRQDSVCETVV